MHQSYVRPGSAAAAVPAIAATTGEYSSDEILVERIAAGDKLAMQVLFARHRTNIYRWLLRFVMSGGRLAALKAVPSLPRGCCRLRASRHSRPAVVARMRR